MGLEIRFLQILATVGNILKTSLAPIITCLSPDIPLVQIREERSRCEHMAVKLLRYHVLEETWQLRAERQELVQG